MRYHDVNRKKLIRWLMFLTGCSLLGLNLAGRLLTLNGHGLNAPGKVPLSAAEIRQIRHKDSRESVRAYALRVNDAVYRGVVHYWPETGEAVDRYRLRVPVYENYLLYLASYIRPDYFKKYEFVSARKALERGIGLCSQQAMAVRGAMKRNGVPARIVLLSGHVVVTAEVDRGEWWVLDPDYGVVIPKSISEIERDPEIIRPYYRAKGYGDRIIDELAAIYGPEGNRLYETRKDYIGWKLYYTEKVSYVLIWVIPAALIALAVGPEAQRCLKRLRQRREVA